MFSAIAEVECYFWEMCYWKSWQDGLVIDSHELAEFRFQKGLDRFIEITQGGQNV